MRDTRQQLIDAGAALFLRRSFQGTGLSDILKAAGVPKGSFYHYFSSKEEFGLAVIAHNQAQQRQLWQSTLGDAAVPPVERLRRYLAALIGATVQNGCELGCPHGTLAQEMSALSPPMREALERAFTAMDEAIAQVVAEGQKTGDIRADVPPGVLARLVTCAMQGALIEVKALKSVDPLEVVSNVLLHVLTPPAPVFE